MVAAALRFVLLTDESLWGDEGISVAVARLDPFAIVRYASDSDTHPPLYYELLHYWMRLVGDSEFAVRSLSTVFGVLAVPVAFALARELTRSAACGVAAGFLVAASPIAVEYSQDARMYALLVLASGASSLCLVRLARSRSHASVALYALTTAALLYSHVYGLFVLSAHVVYALVAWRAGAQDGDRPLRRFLAGGAGALALFSPWAAVLVRQAGEELQGGDRASLDWLAAPGARGAWETVVHWWGAPSVFFAAAAIGAAACALGLPSRPRPRWPRFQGTFRRDDPVLLLSLLTLVPVLVPFAFSHLTPLHVYHYRYTTPAAFAFAVLTAVLAFRLQRPLRLFTVAALFATLVAGTAAYHARTVKTDLRSAVRLLQPDAGRADLIVVEPSWQWQVVDYYLPPGRGELAREVHEVTPERLAATKARGGRVWVLHTGELTGDPTDDGGLSDRVRAIYGPPRVARFHGVEARAFG